MIKRQTEKSNEGVEDTRERPKIEILFKGYFTSVGRPSVYVLLLLVSE